MEVFKRTLLPFFKQIISLILINMLVMKRFSMMIIMVCFATLAFGQDNSKAIQNRLKTVTDVVEVTDSEKSEIIDAIQDYFNNGRQIRKSKGANMNAEIKQNLHKYLSKVKEILGNSRYEIWKKAVEEKPRNKKK